MNNQTFMAGIAVLSKLFGFEPENEIINAYWNILNKVSDDDFIKIQKSLIENFIPTSQVPFPLPAHFLKALGLDIETKTKLAILAIKNSSCNPYQSVSFGDRALHRTIETFGGWPIVACWDLEKWQYNEKQFALTYQAVLKDRSGPTRLAGIFEYENAGKKFAPNQSALANKGNETEYIEWKGFDHSVYQLENKTEKQKLINGIVDNITSKIKKF